MAILVTNILWGALALSALFFATLILIRAFFN